MWNQGRVAAAVCVIVLLEAVSALFLAAPMSNTQARAQAVRLWGSTGSIREGQTGTSTTWTREAGLQTAYGFEPRGQGTGDWSNAFKPLPAPTYRTEPIAPATTSFGRIYVGRDPDTRASDPLMQHAENAKTREAAEERLSKFIDAVCSVSPKACDVAGKEFRVRIVAP